MALWYYQKYNLYLFTIIINCIYLFSCFVKKKPLKAVSVYILGYAGPAFQYRPKNINK